MLPIKNINLKNIYAHDKSFTSSRHFTISIFIQYKRNVNLCIIHMHFIVKNSKLIQRPPRCKVQRACYKTSYNFPLLSENYLRINNKSGNSWHESSIARKRLNIRNYTGKEKLYYWQVCQHGLSLFCQVVSHRTHLDSYPMYIHPTYRCTGKSSHYRIPLTSLHRSKALF